MQYLPKKEYAKVKEKHEDSNMKPVHCCNCRAILAKSRGFVGRLAIECSHCGTMNHFEAEKKGDVVY